MMQFVVVAGAAYRTELQQSSFVLVYTASRHHLHHHHHSRILHLNGRIQQHVTIETNWRCSTVQTDMIEPSVAGSIKSTSVRPLCPSCFQPVRQCLTSRQVSTQFFCVGWSWSCSKARTKTSPFGLGFEVASLVVIGSLTKKTHSVSHLHCQKCLYNKT